MFYIMFCHQILSQVMDTILKEQEADGKFTGFLVNKNNIKNIAKHNTKTSENHNIYFYNFYKFVFSILQT